MMTNGRKLVSSHDKRSNKPLVVQRYEEKQEAILKYKQGVKYERKGTGFQHVNASDDIYTPNSAVPLLLKCNFTKTNLPSTKSKIKIDAFFTDKKLPKKFIAESVNVASTRQIGDESIENSKERNQVGDYAENQQSV
jgi:hypothetical protein